MSQVPNAAAWEQALRQHQDAYSKAEVFSGGWEPALGVQLTAMVKEVTTGIHEGHPNWRVGVELLDGVDPSTGKSYQGKSFSPFWFSGDPKRIGFLKGFLQDVAGAVPNDLVEADAMLKAQIGACLMIVGRPGKKQGTSNWDVKKVLAPADGSATPTPNEEEVPPPAVPVADPSPDAA